MKFHVARFTCVIVITLLVLSDIFLLLRYNRDVPNRAVLRTETIGERIARPTVAFTVHGLRKDETGAGPLTPRKDSQFIIVELSIENLASTSLDVAPMLNFHIKDSTGWVYKSVAVPSMHEMLSGAIPPGDILREEVGFEVAQSATGLRLYYEIGRYNEEQFIIDLHE